MDAAAMPVDPERFAVPSSGQVQQGNPLPVEPNNMTPEQIAELQRQMTLALSMATAQQTSPSLPESASFSTDTLSLHARSYPDLTIAEYRWLSDGSPETISEEPDAPEITLQGYAPESTEILSYSETGAGLVLGVIISGRKPTELETSANLMEQVILRVTTAPKTVLLIGPNAELLAEIPASATTDDIKSAFGKAKQALTAKSGSNEVMPKAFQLLVQKLETLSPRPRGGLLVPSYLFPADEAALNALPGIARQNGIGVFPYADEPSTGSKLNVRLTGLAGQTGGRWIRSDVSVRPDGVQMVFSDLVSGGFITFTPAKSDHYRLPGEAKSPVTLTVVSGHESQTIEMNRPTEILSGTALYLAAINPAEVIGWVSDNERRRVGIYVLLGQIAVLLTGLVLIFRIFRKRDRLLFYAPELSVSQPLKSMPVRIGRGVSMDIILNDNSISREHAMIEGSQSRGYRIVDLGSTNGVWVRGQKVTEHILKSSDHIRLGSVRVRIILLEDQ